MDEPECKHEDDIEYLDVVNTYTRKGEKYRVLTVKCTSCNTEGTVTEVWSPADAEWLYFEEEWA